jgi:sodium/potassium-transporting ATPase subunit beta
MVQEYVFDDVETKTKKGGSFLWNSETREFLGRDGASWAKITFFYAIFYTCLASFFVGMLAVFVSFMPRDVPTYFGDSSKMGIDGINPGLGFRPQVDVEDSLIMYNPLVAESPTEGNLKYIRNLKNFLESKYKKPDDSDRSNLRECKTPLTDDEVKSGIACNFDYETYFKTTDCREDNSFGYETDSPCILLKVNKIVGWKPINSANQNRIIINCTGETSSDKDNVLEVKYHSEGGDINNNISATISDKYFPYYGQKVYRAPFVWAQFKITPNTLVNIECKAWADNIDNKDRLNRRGQTKFSLFISSKK